MSSSLICPGSCKKSSGCGLTQQLPFVLRHCPEGAAPFDKGVLLSYAQEVEAKYGSEGVYILRRSCSIQSARHKSVHIQCMWWRSASMKSKSASQPVRISNRRTTPLERLLSPLLLQRLIVAAAHLVVGLMVLLFTSCS